MNVNILDYIPQRPPFVMVDDIIECTPDFCETSFEIKPDNIFVQNGRFTEGGLVENMAQTCASRIGYMAVHYKHEDVRIGVIGAVKNCEILRLPNVGEKLSTKVVEAICDFNDMSVLKLETSCNNEVIASCEMKVALIEKH